MREIKATIDELSDLYTDHNDKFPNEPLKLVAYDILKRYDEVGTLQEWEYETANVLVNLVLGRMK